MKCLSEKTIVFCTVYRVTLYLLYHIVLYRLCCIIAITAEVRDPYEAFARRWMGLDPYSEEEICPNDGDEDDEEVYMVLIYIQTCFTVAKVELSAFSYKTIS